MLTHVVTVIELWVQEIKPGVIVTVVQPKSNTTEFEKANLPNFGIVRSVLPNLIVKVELLLGKMLSEDDESARVYETNRECLRSADQMKYWAQRRCRGAIYTCAYDQEGMHDSLKCGMAFSIFPGILNFYQQYFYLFVELLKNEP